MNVSEGKKKAGFYPRLAFEGIRKNRRVYLPYILTCIGMVTLFYIMMFLTKTEAISYLRGAETVRSMLESGCFVIGVFACIFLFYTNSFLIRGRKKEFGLYHILGMGKGNIGRILFWETLILAAISLGAGLASGILLSKLAELGLIRIMMGEANYTLSVPLPAVMRTVYVFGLIFILLFLNSVRQIRFSNAIALIRSENVGEKPPKGNWFFGLLGFAILAAAYYLAVSIRDPVAALMVFMIAVLMVIVGTYLVMISGSVLFCRLLQKRKRYYYRANHFVSVSSMVYRMKRNGAGLASICILATMVLVMLSSSACLYFGEDDAVRNRYPRHINMGFTINDFEDISEESIASLQAEIQTVLDEWQITPENVCSYRRAAFAGYLDGSIVETDTRNVDINLMSSFTDVYQFFFIPLSDYNRMTGSSETLEEGEVLLYPFRSKYSGEEISFRGGQSFRIKKQVEEFAADGDSAMAMFSSMYLIVPDLAESVRGLDRLADFNGDRMISLKWTYNFDIDADEATQMRLCGALRERLGGRNEPGWGGLQCESRAQNKEDFFSLFGGLFYLGILLSIVFVLAAVLIIYYKQISEGYEDQARFEIMKKVGMTGREIRKSINSQLLTVFWLPLVLSVCHLAFAFPVIRKLLLLFNLNNVTLFLETTAVSVGVFAVFYMLVYRITSNAYYHIVNETS